MFKIGMKKNLKKDKPVKDNLFSDESFNNELFKGELKTEGQVETEGSVNEINTVDVNKVELTNKEKLDVAKQKNKNSKKIIKTKNKKLFIIIAILIIVISILATFFVGYLNSLKYKPYIQYEEKMKTYGFNKLYNNQSAETSESVTKTEAIKLALGAVFNTYDISGFAAENNEYENSIWTEYAEDTGITKEDINSSNYNNKVKYRDVIVYFENCKMKFLPEQTVKDTEVKLKDIAKYTSEEQAAIKDMIANEIITKLSNKLNGNEYIFKGELNEIVVKFAEKYNTITISGEKININPEKIPSNADIYPYTLANVDKSVYEKELMTTPDPSKKLPVELYQYKKQYYTQVKRYTEEFFNNILNVDYRTITEQNLTEKLDPYLVYKPSESAIKAYVKYVKDNEIIIVGSAAFQAPIYYFDGEFYRARMELKFDIKNSKTKDNLLYLDFLSTLKKTYEKTSYDIFSDYSLTNVVGSPTMYLTESELYSTILDRDKCGITIPAGTKLYIKGAK